MLRRSSLLVLIVVLCVPCFAGKPKSNPNQAIDRIFANERSLAEHDP